MGAVAEIRNCTFSESFLSPLREVLTSDDVNEVVINPDTGVFIEKSGEPHMVPLDISLSVAAIHQLGDALAGETENAISESNPIVSGRVMAWGAPLRVQVVVPPAIESGVSVSIRRYASKKLKSVDVQFVEGKQVNLESRRNDKHSEVIKKADEGDLQGLLRHAIDERFNIVISGGTSSGKTTLAGTLIDMTNPEERLVTIEDARELRPLHKNIVNLVANRVEKSERSPAKLLESSLRMRPDRLIMGEIRGAEAFNFLEAINTGHPGSITTLHSNSPHEALSKLAFMVMRSGTVSYTHLTLPTILLV